MVTKCLIKHKHGRNCIVEVRCTTVMYYKHLELSIIKKYITLSTKVKLMSKKNNKIT